MHQIVPKTVYRFTNTPVSFSIPPALPVYLLARREAILDNWRTACGQDPSLHTASVLSREEFNDRIPSILNRLNDRLSDDQQSESSVLTASEHGLHRWHKGYTLPELLKELGYLYQCLSHELQTYSRLYPQTNIQTLMQAYDEIVRLNQETIEGSIARYDELAQEEAGSRVSTLQIALDQVNELARQRTDVLRTSSHDLRSSLGIIQGAAFMLDLEHQSPEQRVQLMSMLNRNLTTVQTLLENLMRLARLDAGQEPLHITSVDAGKILKGIVEETQPLAEQKQLILLSDGPPELLVEGDALKIQQIAQYLLLNALKNTDMGIISLSWTREDNHCWTMSVQDSGVGLPATINQSLADNLKPSRESTSALESETETGSQENDPYPSTTPSFQVEGIGLHIVKRLCEVLDASMDIESGTGQGMLVRIRLPMTYSDSQKKQ